MLVIAVFYVFCYLWLNNIVVVGCMVNLISLWYSFMYRDLYDIWFLGSSRLTQVVRGDFVTLVVGSQEPSSEWINFTFLRYSSITIYCCIVIFLRQCIDTYKFRIVPSLVLVLCSVCCMK